MFPLVSKWIPALGTAYGINVNYSPIGSGGGIAAITRPHRRLRRLRRAAVARSVHRLQGLRADPVGAVGDVDHVQPAGPQLHAAPHWPDHRQHLPRQDHDLERRGDQGGQPGTCSLPDTKITPVYRSDNSGTTYNFTDYLSAVSPEWKSKLGVRASTSSGLPGVGAKGSSGVAGVVTKTEGAIGYADVAYALKNKLRFASMLNASGKYATPGLRGIQAAADTLPAKITGNGELSIVNPPKGNPLAYPISTFTYVIVPTGSSKAAELRKMVYWAVTTGPDVRQAAAVPAAAEEGAGLRLQADQADRGVVGRKGGIRP